MRSHFSGWRQFRARSIGFADRCPSRFIRAAHKDTRVMTTAVLAPSKSRPIVLWGLRIVLALLFLATAFAKLSGQAMMVTEFDTIGLGQWFRYLTGALELIAAIAVLIP